MSDAEPFGSGQPLVVDTSAWARQGSTAVQERWAATVRAGLVVACPVVALELLATARDEAAFHDLDITLSALPQAPVTHSACRAALGASRDLRARRRLPATDYLIASAAAERGFGVLHYDSHFDALADVLGFQTVWIAPPGTLD